MAKTKSELTKEDFDIPSKLDDARKAVLDLKETLDNEASTLQAERSAFEFMRKKLDHIHFKKHIKLNVGGQMFKTSLETLTKDPDSMLAAMFSEKFDVQPDEEDGAYFIDRDGTHFRFVLNYLRNGRLIFPKENKVLAAELYVEAEFYQIRGLQNEIWTGPTFQNSPYIINSMLKSQKDALFSWIPTPILADWVLIYSQANGWSSSNFHSMCNKKGPTVILAKSGNCIFGGYADVSWDSSGSFLRDENAFLFTLANPTNTLPTKIPMPEGSGGIWCNSSYGPCFGSSSGITIAFMNSTSSSYCGVTDSHGGFQCPEGLTLSSYLFGATTCSMSYLEVFSVKNGY